MNAETLAKVLRQIKKEYSAAFALDDDEDWAGWYAKMLLPWLPQFYPFAEPTWREGKLREVLIGLDMTWSRFEATLKPIAGDWARFYAENLMLY